MYVELELSILVNMFEFYLVSIFFCYFPIINESLESNEKLRVLQSWNKYLKRHQTLNVGFLQKLTSKGTWRQVFICLRPPITPPPPYTLYEYNPCNYSLRKGGKGGG
jgi:hypothetical protein